jgi:arsenate reductase-like glutaredoxin family protein
MKQEKLFDCVFIATDRNKVQKVRYANDMKKREKVLKRDNFTIEYQHSFDTKMTKRQIIDFLKSIEANVDINDEETVLNAERSLNKSDTTVRDILDVIRSRKQDTQTDENGALVA